MALQMPEQGTFSYNRLRRSCSLLRKPTTAGLLEAVAASAATRATPMATSRWPRPASCVRHRPACCRVWASYQTSATNANQGVAVSIERYFGRGPYSVSQLPEISFLAGPGMSGPLDCTLRVYLPQAALTDPGVSPHPSPPQQHRVPLVVLSAGFLLHSSLYRSYAAHMASWGLAVALYDLPEVVDDNLMVSVIGSIINACTRDPRVTPYVDPRAILLAGHSRGGKLSVLAAASDPRVKGIALLDPVDVTSMMPLGPGYPSALPAMRVACGPPRRLPCLVVGASHNSPVIPVDANFRRFISNCPGPCWALDLLSAGHLQFLDMRVDLFSALVGSGPAPDEVVRRVSQAAVTSWALELAVPLAWGKAISGTQVSERLRETAAAIERQTPVSYVLKGLDFLGGPGGATSSSSGSISSGGGSWVAGSHGDGDSGGARQGSDRQREGWEAGHPASSSSAATSAAPRDSQPGASPSGVAASAAAATGGGSAGTCTRSGEGSSREPAGAGAGSGSNGGRGSWRFEELMRMRARELKAILVDRGVKCSDCFEKEDLVRRIMERC